MRARLYGIFTAGGHVPRYTITIESLGVRLAIEDYHLPNAREAKQMTFRIGAFFTRRASQPGQKWRIELTEKDKLLLGFTAHGVDTASTSLPPFALASR